MNKWGKKVWRLRACLVIVFENCFFFCSEKQGEQGKHGEHVSFPYFFCSEKHRKYYNQITIIVFREHQNSVPYVFKNYSQEQFSKT